MTNWRILNTIAESLKLVEDKKLRQLMLASHVLAETPLCKNCIENFESILKVMRKKVDLD